MKECRISGHTYSELLVYLLSLGLLGMLGLLSGLGSSGFFSSEKMPLRLKFDKFRFDWGIRLSTIKSLGLLGIPGYISVRQLRLFLVREYATAPEIR